MFRSLFIRLTALSLFVALFSVFAAAQGITRGVVVMENADGTKTPVANATVQPYRTDIDRGQSRSAQTNRRGEFSFVGFTFGHVYALAVSGEGIAPIVFPNVRAGQEQLEIVVRPGDGAVLTEVQVREILAKAPELAPGDMAAAKQADAEYQKQLEAYNAAKQKADDVNRIVNAALRDGEQAYKANNYDDAIARFQTGIDADPEFEGTAPVLLNWKGVVLKDRGYQAYVRSTQNPAARADELAKARADFDASAASYKRGLEIIEKAAATDQKTKENLAAERKRILTNYVEVLRIAVLSRANTSLSAEAEPVFEKYIAVETDAAARLRARVNLGDIMREAGEMEPAVASYRAALEQDPNQIDALAGIGLSLFSHGVALDDKAVMQEGLDFMQRFVDEAPDTHRLKASVRDSIEYLKNEQKLTPQQQPRQTRPTQRRRP